MADNMNVLKPAIEDIYGRSIAVIKLRLLWIEGMKKRKTCWIHGFLLE